MIEPASLAQSFVVGGFGSAAVLGVVRIASEWIKHRRSSSETRLDDASTADTVSKTYERILRDMRAERADDRQDILALKTQVAALNERIDRNVTTAREARDRAEASEHRSDRNIRLLQKHIGKLSDLMRAAGLVPPEPPVLEPEPMRDQQAELRDAIPGLMYGRIAGLGANAPKDEEEP
jgi:hypothetical protein